MKKGKKKSANKDNRADFKGEDGKTEKDFIVDRMAHWETYQQAAERLGAEIKRKREKKRRKMRRATAKMELNPGVIREGELE